MDALIDEWTRPLRRLGKEDPSVALNFFFSLF